MNTRLLILCAFILLVPAFLFAQPTSPQPPVSQTDRIITQAEGANSKGDHQRAIQLTTPLIQKNSSNHVAFYIRGSARVELGLKSGDGKIVRAGIADAREAIRLKKTDNIMYHLPYLYGMTQLSALEKKEEHAKVAITVANGVVKRSGITKPDKANIVYQRGLANATLGNTEKAIQDYEEVIQLVPEHAGALLTVADMYVSTGNTEKALSSFDRAQRALPKNPLVHNNKGMFLQQQGKAQDAVNAFTKAMQADSKFTMAYTNRGYTLLQSGNARDAETDFTSSLRLTPDQSLAYSLRGTARLKLGKVREAIADHQQVIKQNPKSPVAHADIGFAYYFSRQYALAADSFRTASTLNKEARHLRAWHYMAMILAGKGEPAKKYFDTLIKKEANGRDWIDTLFAYVGGYVTDAQLTAATKNENTKTQTDRTCEANFFIGMKFITANKKEEAMKHFKLAVATGSRHLSAFRGAEFALK